MHGRKSAAAALVRELARVFGAGKAGVECVLCPPFTLLQTVGEGIKGSALKLGAQDCAAWEDGAYTGDVSASMLKDMGCSMVILGHSERREAHQETDAMVAAKMRLAHQAGLKVILCVGEKSAGEPDAQRRVTVQLQLTHSLSQSANAENTVIAYEPVWAIGSGVTPTCEQIRAMHTAIGQHLGRRFAGMRVLYGGSVKADNAAAILKLPEVDGALVGGASLEADSFLKIVGAA